MTRTFGARYTRSRRSFCPFFHWPRQHPCLTAGRSGEEVEVPDPFGGDLADYRETYHRLESMLDAVVERVARERARGER